MAYDPNDAEDKKIVDKMIADAVAEALETERETHTAEVERLSNKNKELLGKLRKARTGEAGDDTGEIERLERELDENGKLLRQAQADLREANRQLKQVGEERDTVVSERDSERNYSRNMLIESSLTSALVEANVAPHFMEAAKALIGKSATVEMNGDERKVIANGKPIVEFVKEWATGDAGKHYIVAPANGGGGASNANGGGSPGSKKWSELNDLEKKTAMQTDPIGATALMRAEGFGQDNPNIAA